MAAAEASEASAVEEAEAPVTTTAASTTPAEAVAAAAPSSSLARPAKLPLARVKALVKADPDVTLASQEAVFVLARAAELFVETIAKDAFIYAQRGKRKTLQRKDLDNAIEATDEFAFLEGTLD
ncbi:DNA polymerase epsilon subunit 4 [Pogona vitticeps]|nr:DNA polymerase epsilon subunit 4 [Pogona vitticeps]